MIGRQKVGFIVDATDWQKFKLICVAQRRTLSDMLGELIRRFVQDHEEGRSA